MAAKKSARKTQARKQLRLLREAQHSLCAGCGTHVPSWRRTRQFHPDYPTFDHIITRALGGGRTLDNGLLKHRRGNEARGNSPPTGCDRIWHHIVLGFLETKGHPRSPG